MFRFTIRELVLLTLVVGWWLDQSQLAIPAADHAGRRCARVFSSFAR
jgi:hypothetical protein